MTTDSSILQILRSSSSLYSRFGNRDRNVERQSTLTPLPSQTRPQRVIDAIGFDTPSSSAASTAQQLTSNHRSDREHKTAREIDKESPRSCLAILSGCASPFPFPTRESSLQLPASHPNRNADPDPVPWRTQFQNRLGKVNQQQQQLEHSLSAADIEEEEDDDDNDNYTIYEDDLIDGIVYGGVEKGDVCIVVEIGVAREVRLWRVGG
ncbi:uncharacterized protein RSE6_01551 [Rhynchosporium secalis]|uniref:Uncharacterized protein n=1 Tax=Rhynchosporium secalis TaxID=38038 RepID=A0A1E1LY30_RHYSE|nr:uncharacterized protein RSE6_01551 [Rhynchosporium secalis]